MIKLLIISHHFPPDLSGNASRIYDLSKKLVELDCQVKVISPFPTFPHGLFRQRWKLFESTNIDGISHLKIFSWNITQGDPSFLQRIIYYLFFPIHAILWTVINRNEFDIVLSTAPPIFTGITGFFAKKFLKKKFIYDVRDLWIQVSVTLGFIKNDTFYLKISRLFEQKIYKKCDLITVTTSHIKNKIIQQNQINEKKIEIIPNGVDTSKFTVEKEKSVQIIYAGNVGHAQDFKKVILAVKKINKTKKLNFLIVGDGDIKKTLEKYVKIQGLEDIIIFIDSIDRKHIPSLLSESLIGIAPLKTISSLEYALPTKIYEYMAAGIPFIATGKGEIQLLVDQSKAGLIAENTIDSLYENIMMLLENKELRKSMGEKGKHFSKLYCDRGKIAQDLYNRMKNI